MELKSRPHHVQYLRLLRQMSSEERLRKAFELGALSRELFRHGLRQRFPELSEEEFRRLYLSRLDLCHNRNY